MSKSDDDNVYELPLHATSTRRQLQRTRGRPRTVTKRPIYRQGDREQWLRQQLDEHVDRDSVVRAVRDSKGARDLINVLSVELAREAAGLEFERRRHTAGTRDAERTSSRRVKALVELARLQLVRAEMQREHVDPRSTQVQRVVAMFVARVGAVVAEVLPAELAARIMERWRAALEGWEAEVDAQA